MRCSQCGQSIDHDSKFCKFCGKKVDTTIVVGYIYSIKSRNIKKESNLPQDSDFSSEIYYWNFDKAQAHIRDDFDRKCRMAVEDSSHRAGAMCYPGYDKRGTYFDFVNQHPNNSLDNIIQYYDSYYQYNGKLWHSTNELSLAKITPPLVVNPNSNQDICIFIYEEYIVLNDDVNNHIGYKLKEEFFSDSAYAMNRQQEEYLKYKYDSSYSFEVIDDRNSYVSRLYDFNSVYFYAIHIYKSGHKIRLLNVCASILF